jgi:hypothetical protein
VRYESGQATIEWVGLVLVAALALGGLAAVTPAVDGRALGGFLAHHLTCATTQSCERDATLASAYGPRDAQLVRRHLQGLVFEPGERQLPVDWRRCRAVECATVSDDRDLDAHRTATGATATAFTRLVERGDRRYIQYWFYYPDSNSAVAGSDRLWRRSALAQVAGKLLTGSRRYPGSHRDDWEGVAVRLDRDGTASVRATSHGHWQWCKQRFCRGRWGPATGWSRVSRGSHAGHIPFGLPGRDLHERTATAEGIRLVPLERLDRHRYRRFDRGIAPPWRKEAYADPESSES